MSELGQGENSPRDSLLSARKPWPMARDGTPAGLASIPEVDAARRRLKVRNAVTAFGIAAIAVGIYGYTMYSISQERFLDELELEAEVMRARAAKNAAD